VAQRTEELRRALATVEGQARKLEKLDAAKSKFFTNLSHEFRTPLMLTLGPLRDLQSGRHGAVSPEALATVELAIRNTGRQLELVDQLLMLARLDARQIEFRPRESRLDEFLRQAVAPYESLAARQQVQFRCELPEPPVAG
jgi:signal transduction histidine kinase